jgi:hypothetical protein
MGFRVLPKIYDAMNAWYSKFFAPQCLSPVPFAASTQSGSRDLTHHGRHRMHAPFVSQGINLHRPQWLVEGPRSAKAVMAGSRATLGGWNGWARRRWS